MKLYGMFKVYNPIIAYPSTVILCSRNLLSQAPKLILKDQFI